MIREYAKQDVFFELALAVGQSINTKDNCRRFLDALFDLKEVRGAGIWLGEKAEALKLIYALPEEKDFTSAEKKLPLVMVENKHQFLRTPEGALRDFFPLRSNGILVIDWEEAVPPLGGEELRVLKRVIEKLAISLEGNLSYERLKKAEHRLLSTERKQRQIIETSPDAVILVDGNACVQEWGPRAERLFHVTADEALGHRWYKLVVPYREWEKQDRHLDRFQRFEEFPVEQFIPVEIIAIDRTGREFSAEMTFSYLKLKGEAHFCLFIRDISDRKASQAELIKAQTRLSALISNLQTGILVESEDRRIVLVNQYFCSISNNTIPPDALLGRDSNQVAERFKHFFEDPEGFVRKIDELLAQRKTSICEILTLRDGRVYERDYIPIYVDEEYLGHMWQYRNVTEQKRKEDELRKAKSTAEAAKLAERRFLTNMSHEIRTPMNTVIGMIYLLNETRLDESQREYLEALHFSADSLLAIINNVLDLSKIEAGEIDFETHPFSLETLLNAIQKNCQLQLRNRPLQIEVSIAPAIDSLLIGDYTRLSQIINNLLSNAEKFTEQGTIRIEVSIRKDYSDSFVLEFAISDTGMGMPAEQLPLVFENFKQLGRGTARKYGGTGLGLSIVKQLVELQGGQIEVESQLRKGSVFRFFLPFQKGPKEDKRHRVLSLKVEEESLDASLGYLNILVVEDNPPNQLLISRILERWGSLYRLAADGVQATQLLQETSFDLILMDLHMPGFSGYAVAEQLRRSDGHPNQYTPIVAITAAALLDECKRVFEVGMNDLLTKPFSPQALYQLILKWTSPAKQQGETPKNRNRHKEAGNPLAGFRYLYDLSQGDEQFIGEMVEMFLKEASVGFREMEQAAEKEDWELLFQTAHRLKPSCEMMELKGLKRKLAALEKLLKPEPAAPAEVKMRLEVIIRESQREIERIRWKKERSNKEME